MKKRLSCNIEASIDIEVDIPDHLIKEFELSDTFRDWGKGQENSEIYEILNDTICRNLGDLNWEEIEIYNEENIDEVE